MAERVVDRLEVIDVDDGERDGLVSRCRVVQHQAGLRKKTLTQHQSRQVIMRCHSVADACIGPTWRREIHRARRRRAGDILEQAKERRIELFAHVKAHDLDRLVVRQRAFVAAVRRQRIVHVGEADDTRPQRNPLSTQCVGIACAIPVLMVVPHDRVHIVRKVDLFQDVGAGTGMQLHHIPLVGRQAFGFVQNLRRDHDLANVVQQCADAEPEDRILLDPGAARECARQVRDAFAMSLRVRVLLFDRLAPFVHDIEHVAFEASDQCGHGGHRLVGAQLREQLVRAVQRLQQLARAALSAIQLRAFAGDLRTQQQIFALLGDRLGAFEMSLGRVGVIGSDRNRAEDLLYLAVGVRVTVRRRPRQRAFAQCTSLVVVAALQPRIGDVDLDHRGSVRVADRLRERERVIQLCFGRIEVALIEIQSSEIVLRDGGVARVAQ